MDDYAAYIGIGHNQPAELPEITKLAEQTFAQQQEVNRLETALKDAQAKLKQLSEYTLPEAMDNAGMSTYTTTTGISVEVEEKLRGRLTVENRPRGYEWLEKNGYGALVKSEVIIKFNRTKLEEANKLVEKLREEGKVANLEKNVHHSTLDAFIREQLSEGKDIPLDIFSVDRNRIAQVTVND